MPRLRACCRRRSVASVSSVWPVARRSVAPSGDGCRSGVGSPRPSCRRSREEGERACSPQRCAALRSSAPGAAPRLRRVRTPACSCCWPSAPCRDATRARLGGDAESTHAA
eukprot:5250319-Pleurochrysis_carterae.AAC.1